MKKNVMLIDLSLFSGIVITLACLSLISVGAGLAASAQHPLEMLIELAVGMLPAIAAFWYFWWKSPVLTPDGVRQGKKQIARDSLKYETFYDTRYRESIICFYDASKPFDKNDRKSKNRITVQATKRNLKLLERWMTKESEESHG